MAKKMSSTNEGNHRGSDPVDFIGETCDKGAQILQSVVGVGAHALKMSW